MAVQLDTAHLLPESSGVSTALSRPSASGAGSGATFSDTLGRLLEAVDTTTGKANIAVEKMLDGSIDPHEAMIALHEAETAFQMTVQIRNKFVQAYQEVMRMTI